MLHDVIKMNSRAPLVAPYVVISGLIPSHPTSGLWNTHSEVVCLATSMHSSHSSPPRMKISWLPQRGHSYHSLPLETEEKWKEKVVPAMLTVALKSTIVCNTHRTRWRLFHCVKIFPSPAASGWHHPCCGMEKFCVSQFFALILW